VKGLTSQPLYAAERPPVPVERGTKWAPQAVWTFHRSVTTLVSANIRPRDLSTGLSTRTYTCCCIHPQTDFLNFKFLANFIHSFTSPFVFSPWSRIAFQISSIKISNSFFDRRV